jgi:hypothetical protein
MKKSNLLKLAVLALPLVLASCSSKKKVVQETQPVTVSTEHTTFLNKVKENTQTTKFITSKVKFSVEVGAQDITLTGNLKMKRDDVIRLQLMAFGFVEAARLEFTKDYVLIMDRINKQYLKAPYISVDFLRNSGINFNTLQALFWGELFQPNRTTLNEEDFKRYTTNMDEGEDVVITLEDTKLDYSWLANYKTGLIKMANILYKDRLNGNAQLNWDYAGFATLENSNKKFPDNMNVTLTTQKKEVKLGIKLNYIGHDAEWETRTEISNKYREVTIDEILQRFMAL